MPSESGRTLTPAQRWARWSVAWSAVGPFIEPQPWFQAFDAHEKAYCREAVTKSVLMEPRWNKGARIGVHQAPLAAWAMRRLRPKGIPASDDKEGWAARREAESVWVDRLSKIADAARESLSAPARTPSQP